MEELTKFDMKNTLILPSLANKHFNSLGEEHDQLIFTYTDPFMRNFVRQSKKRGRCKAFNQCYLPVFSDNVFNNISKELDCNGNICEILDKCFEFLNK